MNWKPSTIIIFTGIVMFLITTNSVSADDPVLGNIFIVGAGGGSNQTLTDDPTASTGGGGGQALIISGQVINASPSYHIVVGTGGGVQNWPATGGTGGVSTAFGFTALGGLGGATTTGGSNGAGTHVGGASQNGGGAGDVGNGAAGNTSFGGNGGTGTTSSITGSPSIYAEGGGGGGHLDVGSGGAYNGTLGTGSGGRGSTYNFGNNGAGGVVIISYVSSELEAIGGDVSISGNRTIHTFRATGDFILTPPFEPWKMFPF